MYKNTYNSKVKIHEFSSDTLSPVYLFHGEDHPLLKKNLQALMDILIPSEYRDGNLLIQSGREFNPLEVMDFCDTLPFLYHKRVVLIENCPFLYESRKSKKKVAATPEDQFVDWLESNLANNPTFCIVFTLLEDNEKISLSKLSPLNKSISKKGKIFTFPLPEEIVEFIEHCAASRQKDALNTLNRIYARGIDSGEISYRLMTRLRYYLKKGISQKLPAGLKSGVIKSDLNFYLDSLDVENRLRPRDMDLMSEDSLYVLEEWILNDQRCKNKIE